MNNSAVVPEVTDKHSGRATQNPIREELTIRELWMLGLTLRKSLIPRENSDYD